MYEIDVAILQWLNSWVFWRPWADALIIFRAEYFGYLALAGLVAFGVAAFLPRFFHLRRKNWEMILVAFVAALISRFGVVELIRFFYDRPRPFEALPDLHRLVSHSSGGSFPSGHAAFYFAIAAVVSRYYPKMSLLFYALALSLSINRIAAGLHWPSDIVGGAIIGIAVGLLAVSVYQKLLKPKPAA